MKRLLVVGFLGGGALGAQVPGRPPSQRPEADVGTPKSTRLLPPSKVRINISGAGTEISWDPMALKRVKSYEVFRLDDKYWTKIKTVPDTSGAVVSYTDTGNRDAKRFYCIAAVDSSGIVGMRSKPVNAQALTK